MQQQAPKGCEMSKDLAGIVAAGAKNSADPVATTPLQRASGKASVRLHMPDLRLSGTTAPQELC